MTKEKIKILFDASPLVNGQKSGVGYYTKQLIESLALYYPENVELVGHYFNFLGRKKSDELPAHPNIRYRQSRILPGKLLSLFRKFGFQIPFDLLIKERGDIAFFPNFVSLPCVLPIKKVVAIHDLCYMEFPEYLQAANAQFLKRFVPGSIASADLLVTISDATKQAITKHYPGQSKGKPFTITPIPPPPARKNTSKENFKKFPDKYILFVSTLEPRKNFIALVRAYVALPKEILDTYGLVLAGGMGWNNAAELKEIKQLQLDGFNIITTGYVDQNTRDWLYSNASLFVFPSHYEGFGMPILEAMSYGLPVAVSNIPVFKEVSKDAVVYFDKDNIQNITDVMKHVLASPALADDFVIKGGELLKQYSWQKTAAVFMEATRIL